MHLTFTYQAFLLMIKLNLPMFERIKHLESVNHLVKILILPLILKNKNNS